MKKLINRIERKFFKWLNYKLDQHKPISLAYPETVTNILQPQPPKCGICGDYHFDYDPTYRNEDHHWYESDSEKIVKGYER